LPPWALGSLLALWAGRPWAARLPWLAHRIPADQEPRMQVSRLRYAEGRTRWFGPGTRATAALSRFRTFGDL